MGRKKMYKREWGGVFMIDNINCIILFWVQFFFKNYNGFIVGIELYFSMYLYSFIFLIGKMFFGYDWESQELQEQFELGLVYRIYLWGGELFRNIFFFFNNF